MINMVKNIFMQRRGALAGHRGAKWDILGLAKQKKQIGQHHVVPISKSGIFRLRPAGRLRGGCGAIVLAYFDLVSRQCPMDDCGLACLRALLRVRD